DLCQVINFTWLNMVMNFLSCSAAVSFGYLNMESESVIEILDTCTDGNPLNYMTPSPELSVLPDIVLSNTTSASVIKGRANRTSFHFPEEPQKIEISNIQSGARPSICAICSSQQADSLDGLVNGNILSPADNDHLSKSCGHLVTGYPGRGDVTTYSPLREMRDAELDSVQSRQLMKECHICLYQSRYSNYCFKCQQCHKRQEDFFSLLWRRVPTHSWRRHSSRHSHRKSIFNLAASTEQRHCRKLVGLDLRKVADNFQVTQSKRNYKEGNSISIIFVLPLVLTRFLSAKVLCLLRWN
ncbi:hypothetical protein SK128_027194, partial [Halocaridina rubra]